MSSRLLLALLLAACAEPSPAADSAPEGLSEAPEEPEEVSEEGSDDPEAPEEGDLTFPEAFHGCFRCMVTSIYYRATSSEPTERERDEATLTIGRNAHAPGYLIANIEGCPFFISGVPQGNPNAFAIGPNRCGATLYRDGFLILRTDTHTTEPSFHINDQGRPVEGSGGQTIDIDTLWVSAQLTGRIIRGRNRGAHAVHTYLCMQDGCLR